MPIHYTVVTLAVVSHEPIPDEMPLSEIMERVIDGKLSGKEVRGASLLNRAQEIAVLASHGDPADFFKMHS